MKKLLIASAAAAAVFAAAPAFAADQPTGYVGVDYSHNSLDAGSLGNGDANTYGVSGAAAFKLSPALNLQVDGNLQRVDTDGSDFTTGGLTGHLFTRNDSYAAGAFLGWNRDDNVNFWNGGVEGQKFIGNNTLAGQIGYGKYDHGLDLKVWNINAEERYFVNDNFRLNGGAAWNHVDGFGGNGDVWSVGVGGEYQFAKAPVSIYANYKYSDFNDADLKSNAVMVGVRWNFGGGSLKTRDRNGASFTNNTGLADLLF